MNPLLHLFICIPWPLLSRIGGVGCTIFMHPVQMGKVVDLVAGLDHCQIVLNEVTVRDVNFVYYKNQLLF